MTLSSIYRSRLIFTSAIVAVLGVSRSKVSAPTWRRFRGCLLTPFPTPGRLLAGCCAVAWKRPITRDDTITTTTKAAVRLTQGRVESKRRECHTGGSRQMMLRSFLSRPRSNCSDKSLGAERLDFQVRCKLIRSQRRDYSGK